MFSGFKISESIHASQYTEVFRAIRESDDQKVILKVRSDLDFQKSKIDLEREHTIGKTLKGNCFITYLELNVQEPKSLLVIKDDNMMPLKSEIFQKGFDLSRFFKLAIEIAAAIEQMHFQGVIHRDINPSNIIVNKDLNSIKLIDFGLASRISEERVGFDAPLFLQGTLSFISPEQTGRINKPVDLRTDLYSLGITLFQMITGVLPFKSADPVDLIHSHIAKTPPSILKLRQDMPPALALIIQKLLMKSPDDRYQMAKSIKKDLILLQKAFSEGLDLEDFIPGKGENVIRLNTGDKLYGRDNESKILLESFNNCNKSGQLVTVTGPSGIGKTALISELYTHITTSRGFFLSGKFGQFDQRLAYTAIADALRNFLKQCRGQDKKSFGFWKEKVQHSVGDFGHILISIVPEFEELIGKQPEIATVSPLETIDRRNLVFSNLITDICSTGFPIVIFLDDLQWSDSATLSMLGKIIEKDQKNLLVILTYRDEEISEVHPFKIFLDDFNTKNIIFTNIHLKTLNNEAVEKWMNEIFPDIKNHAEELAKLINVKTEGNPFFITSFLHFLIDENHIRQENGIQVLDIDAIAGIPIESDVIKHLINQIKTLSTEYLSFLTRISILGNSFTLKNVSLFLNKSYNEYQDSIDVLIKRHLLVKIGEKLMFAHDRVQQAARALVNENEAGILHLKAGLNLKAAYESHDMSKNNVEQYVHHLNAAEDLIKDKTERLMQAKRNIQLGKQLKNKAAYPAAENAFAQAVIFLPASPFKEHYSISVDLFSEFGEILFLNHKYKEGEIQFKRVISNSTSPIDQANVYIKQIVHHASHHNLEKSMNIVFHALNMLGVKLPKKMLKLAVITNILRVKSMLKKKNPEEILNFPETDNNMVIAQMNVLSAAAVPAYIGYPDYYPIIILKMMRISINMGNCRFSPFAYINYALILCSLGNVENGLAYGNAAAKLMEKLKAKDLYTKIPFMLGAFISHWKLPLKRSIELFERAIVNGLETGDYEFASYSANNIMHFKFYNGEKINTLLDEYPKQHKKLEAFNKNHAIFEAKFFNQMLIALSDVNGDGITICGNLIDEKKLMQQLEESKDLTSMQLLKLGKMTLAYLAGNYELADSIRESALKLLIAVIGSAYNIFTHFIAALTCISFYRTQKRKNFYLRSAEKSLKKLNKWGADSPHNYLCKAQLLEAELLAIKGKQTKALKKYEMAIGNASKVGNNLDLGIACECMGRYLLSIDLKSYGLIQIQQSIDVFHNWGALNKSQRLRKEFNMSLSKNKIENESVDSTGSSPLINLQLDLDVLAGTIKSLTGDLQFSSLLEKLLDAVMKSSGASRVAYIKVEEDQLTVRAEKFADNNIKIIDRKNTSLNQYSLPVELIENCYRRSEDYILENIETNGKSRLKSVLLITLKRYKSVKGIVYLENDLMEDAFRPAQIQFLTLLAGQAEVALENALVFEKLNAERNYSSSIIQISPSLIYGIGNDGITRSINPAIEKITGYKKEEVIGTNWWELFYPGLEYQQVEKLFEFFSNGEVIDYEMQLTCKDGRKRDIVWNSFSRWDNNNWEIIGFGNDVTEQKLIEKALKDSEKKFRLLANNLLSVMIYQLVIHPDGTRKFTYVSDNIRTINQIDPIALLEDSAVIYNQIIPDQLPALIEAENIAMKNMAVFEYEAQLILPNGEARWFQFYSTPQKLPDNSVLWDGVEIDITSRKKAEKDLQHLRNYLSNIIDSMPSMLVGVDPKGIITQWNQEAVNRTGLAVEETVGKALGKIVPRLASEMTHIHNAIKERVEKVDPKRPHQENGNTIYEDITIYPLVANGVDGAVIRIDDVTERIHIEEMIVQSEKMVSVGGLAAGMAHEINNPLAGMMQTANVMTDRLTNLSLPANIRSAEKVGISLEVLSNYMKERGIVRMLDSIRESGKRVSLIVANMLSFARKSDSNFHACNLSELLDQTTDLAGSDYNLKKKFDFRQIDIQREYEDDMPEVYCESAKIQQVLLNILRNGAESMKDTSDEGKNPKFIFQISFESETKMARIMIEDNGPGMDETTCKRIFEPFFTTKPTNQGTGLGLSVSYFIITENHGGKMVVESKPGIGTKFIIQLPVGGKKL